MTSILNQSLTRTIVLASNTTNASEENLPQFDETSWTVFINCYKAEVSIIQTTDMIRFRHMRRGIDKLWMESQEDTSNHLFDAAAKQDFETWWKEMGGVTQEFEKDVSLLEPPSLDEVRNDRLSQGLHI